MNIVKFIKRELDKKLTLEEIFNRPLYVTCLKAKNIFKLRDIKPTKVMVELEDYINSSVAGEINRLPLENENDKENAENTYEEYYLFNTYRNGFKIRKMKPDGTVLQKTIPLLGNPIYENLITYERDLDLRFFLTKEEAVDYYANQKLMVSKQIEEKRTKLIEDIYSESNEILKKLN